MPIYDFICTGCGNGFEDFAPVDPGEERLSCPACGSSEVSRQIVSRIAVRTRVQRRGGVVDLSSGACPCVGHKHAH